MASHWRGDLEGLNGTESISNMQSITADSFVGPVTGNVTSTEVRATSFIQIGGGAFLFSGSLDTQASILVAGQALVTNASLPGSLYLSTEGESWVFTSSALATMLTTA